MAVHLTDEQSDVEVDVHGLVRLARYVLADQAVPIDMDVSLLLVDATTIAGLNETHMGSTEPTDVLAFPIDEPGMSPPDVPAVLGDVVLCPAIAHDQASQFGRTGAEEVELLVVHGLLHLLGMDHADPASEAEMFGLTDRLLDDFHSGTDA